MSKTIAGTTIQVYVESGTGLLVLGTVDNGGAQLDTTAGRYAPGATILDLSTLISWKNTGTTAAPVWASAKKSVNVVMGTIATTSTTDAYIIVPETGVLESIDLSPLVALATDDTNYITFSVTNLGQAGAGSTAMLATSPAGINTTKITGGTALAVNTKMSLTLSTVAGALNVTAGDRLRIRATASGTLANTVTVPVFCLRFNQIV